MNSPSAVMDEDRGFATLIKRQIPTTEFMNCCLCREALMIQVLPIVLSNDEQLFSHCQLC